jgi:hypothetical protein
MRRRRSTLARAQRRSDRLYRCSEGTVCCERFVRGQECLPTHWGAAVNGRVQQHLLNISD